MVGEIERVLAALERAGVRYLVVGGVAVVLHGFLRTTADLDLVVHLEPDNVRRALNALTELGYHPRAPVPPESFADPETRKRWIRDKNLRVFSFWSEAGPLEVDLFVEEPFDFEDVFRRAVRVPLKGIEVSVVPRRDLIALKRAAGRALDQEDVQRLQELGGGDE
ncbi:MAG: nucleotidyl transferase AbiEii/AbiGii toxin family protein [Thermoanaerobaculia bacterium]